MKVENMTYNAKTAFTERREIIDKLNECINSINTYGSEKIKDLESKNIQQDADIDNLKNADKDNVKINKVNEYAVGLTGNQSPIAGSKHFASPIYHTTNIPLDSDGVYRESYTEYVEGTNNDILGAVKYSNGNKTVRRNDFVFNRINGVNYKATLRLQIDPSGIVKLILLKDINGTETQSEIARL